MHIKYTDSNDVYSRVIFNEEANTFRLCGEHSNFLEYNPVLKLDSEYQTQNFSYLLLANESPACTENSIYQVYVGKQRIGWIFPLQALLSEEHDQSKNPYFLKYAYVALCLLLQDVEEIDKREMPGEFFLEDYYDPKQSILVIDGENTAKLDSFLLENYIVGLFQYGYAFKGKGNIWAERLPIETQSKITLKALSPELSAVPNINFLFKEQLPVAENEVIRFYLCYQIIELLIAVVFEDQFQSILAKISEDSEALFDQRDNLSKISSEKHRIKILFSNYVSCETVHQTDLDLACKKLLDINGKAVSSQYYENLYSVRCLLVHRLYTLSADSYDILQDINKPFLNVIMDILFSFKKPT